MSGRKRKIYLPDNHTYIHTAPSMKRTTTTENGMDARHKRGFVTVVFLLACFCVFAGAVDPAGQGGEAGQDGVAGEPAGPFSVLWAHP